MAKKKYEASPAENMPNNSNKIDFLLEIWYKETFDSDLIGKLNLEKNEFVKNTKQGIFSDYLQHIQKKNIARISNNVVTLSPEQKALQLVFWYNTGCLDSSNFQNGVLENADYNKSLKRDIQNYKKEDGKIVVVMAGNLIGKEWQFKNLKDAFTKMSIEWDGDNVKKEIRRIFYGLKKRKQRVINDIKYALRCGADEVLIMKGPEEFDVFKKTGYDVMEDIVKAVDDERLKYITDGTETKINVVKENGRGKKAYYNTMRISHTNNTKSANPSIMERPGQYLKMDRADVAFICGGNYTAAVKNENEFFPSGQLTYQNTQKSKKPEFMFNDGNVYQVYPEGDNELTVVKGGQCLYQNNLPLYQNIFNQKQKINALGQLAKEKIDEKIAEIQAMQVKANKGREL
jgi:hypothetical protein